MTPEERRLQTALVNVEETLENLGEDIFDMTGYLREDLANHPEDRHIIYNRAARVAAEAIRVMIDATL